MKKLKEPKITPAEFRKSLGVTIDDSKIASMCDIADAIREFAKDKHKNAK